MNIVHTAIENDFQGKISLKSLEVLQEITAMTNNMLIDAIDERSKHENPDSNVGECCENMTDEHGEPSLYCCEESDNQDYLNHQLRNEEK